MSRVSGLAERIRLSVLRGEAAAGTRLVEVQLAQELDAPRSTIRQALRLLEGQDLLVADESGGMRVVAPDARDVAEALDVRAALEGLGAELAAARGLDGAAAQRLLDLAERARVAAADERSTPDGRDAHGAGVVGRRRAASGHRAGGAPADGVAHRRAVVVADRTFHRALSACADHRAAHVALDRVWDRLVVAGAAPGPAADHARLVAFVAAGDAEAAGDLARRHALSGA